MNLPHRSEPKRWYNTRKCGCATTSVHHPWVVRGTSLSGSPVWTCPTHSPATPPTIDPEAGVAGIIERVAKTIYLQWTSHPHYVPWVEGGNSHKQEAARSLARAAVLRKDQA